MPTGSGIATLVTAVVLLVGARVFGIFELYILGAALLALVACACAWVLLNWRALRVGRTVEPARLPAGTTSVVSLNLRNDRIIPTPVARITDTVQGEVVADAHIPPLRRHRSTRANYRVPTTTRGVIPIGPMHTVVTDPFALARVKRTSAPDTSLLVLPVIEPIAAPPRPGGDQAAHPDRIAGRLSPSGDEFASLRTYAVGDDLRKVHWPSTARTGELLVRTEQMPEHGYSTVVLDVRRSSADAETFERMVSAAASLVAALHDRGDVIQLATTDGSDLMATDTRSYDRMLDHLAVVAQTADGTARLPGRKPGTARAETAVMVMGHDAGEVFALAQRVIGSRARAFAVYFPGDSPTAIASNAALGLLRMVPVAPSTTFAEAWSNYGVRSRPTRGLTGMRTS